jgi:predicted nucleic acid-binding protein
VTGSEVLFDTWAWWEVLEGSPAGAKLRRRYLNGDSKTKVLTSTITLAELSARLSAAGHEEVIESAIISLRNFSTVIDVTADLAVRAGPLRTALRKRDRSASLADALVLVTARDRGATVISADTALVGEPDVTPV